MHISSTLLYSFRSRVFLVAACIALAVTSSQAQTNVRDFGPPRGNSAYPTTYASGVIPGSSYGAGSYGAGSYGATGNYSATGGATPLFAPRNSANASYATAPYGSAYANSYARPYAPTNYAPVAVPAQYVAPSIAPGPSPYAQAGYQPINYQVPPQPVSPYGSNYSAYGNRGYTSLYAPNNSLNNWSSTSPRNYTGRTLFGTNTVYGKDQPLRNIGRFLIP